MELTNNQLRFLEALKGSLGIISKAADACNMHRNSHFKWIHNSPEYKEEADAIIEDCIDVVEDALMRKITDDRDTTAMIFFLKTKGRSRGYIERHEYDHTSLGEKMKVVNLILKTDEK